MRIFVAWLGLCALVGFVERAAAQAAPFTKTPVAADGLVANLYAPANGGRRLPGIIVLGGSEGGMGEGSAIEAALLAEHGFAAMHLGYFDVPGRSKVLEGLPLEYFKTAIDWLRAQGNVDRDKIAIVGGSKGAEAALLIASLYPQIKAVVAGAPSSVVWPGIRGTRNGSSWTLAGADLPALPYGREGGFTSVFALYDKGLKKIDQHPDAVIAVEKIAGPVMLICGRDDTLWPSCPMSDQIVARLKARAFKHTVELLAYPDAGHACFGPPVPVDSERYGSLGDIGGTPAGNNAARAESWAKLLAFLDAALN